MFDALLSNNRMKKELTKAVLSDKPMQAYLFIGADGMGKMTAAKLLASELVKNSKDKVFRSSHPDVIIPKPLENKKIISIDQLRELRADAFVHPSEGIRKIYIIDLSIVDRNAQNALLTILEQPPSFAVFILLCESGLSVLQTVVSRCAVFEMECVGTKEGARYLQKLSPGKDTDTLESIMSIAQGNLGLAIEYMKNDALQEFTQTCESIMLDSAHGNQYGVAAKIMNLPEDNIVPVLSMLAIYIRDILVFRLSGNGDGLVFKSSILQNASEFDKMDTKQLYGLVEMCEDSIDKLKKYINRTIVCANAVIRLCGGKTN